MNLPFNIRKIDYHKLADIIINSPSVKETVQKELWRASCNKDISSLYSPTKPIKNNFHPSVSINIDFKFFAEPKVRMFGQDYFVLKLFIDVYENEQLIGSRGCYLHYDNPQEDYTNFDIISVHDHSEISKEGLKAINNWCAQQKLCQDQIRKLEIEEYDYY